MTYDAVRQETILFGGFNYEQRYQNDTWTWNGTEWNMVADGGPQERSEHALAFDDARGVAVMFGGRNGDNTLADTWEWDGVEWHLVSETGPPARRLFAMAFDQDRGVVVLFGGRDADSGLLGNTWEWNGAAWAPVSDSGPTPRAGHVMAYDRARGVTVLFGGDVGEGLWLNDTWTWDGVEWNQAADSGPTARYVPAMVYEDGSNQCLLFGGGDENGLVGDTWAWDGSEWHPLAEAGPVPRWIHAMAYDREHGVTVMHGGFDAHIFRDDTWEWISGPYIVDQPDDLVVSNGEPAEFHISVNAGNDVTYQWRRNGFDLVDGGTISGSTTDTLRIERAWHADSGSYDVVISSERCGAIESQSAILEVTGPLLDVDATCPGGGPIIVSWQDATPSGDVAILFAASKGAFVVPDGFPCAGTQLGLSVQALQIVFQGATGEDGMRTIHASAGPRACGGFLQLVDLETCAISNAAEIE